MLPYTENLLKLSKKLLLTLELPGGFKVSGSVRTIIKYKNEKAANKIDNNNEYPKYF